MSARRVDQLLSSLGYGTRAEAKAWCLAGRVTVSGRVVRDASERVDASAVRLDGGLLDAPDGLLVMLHKPLGVVCSHDSHEGPTIYDALPERWTRRSPTVTSVGRLDKDTTGLLLITDQGALVQRLTSPRHHVDKVYLAELDDDLSDEAIAAFARGLQLEGEPALTLPAQAARRGPRQVEVTVSEGRYHQVRRMFAAVGRVALTLHRVRFGQWELADLPVGQWRALPLP